MKLHNVLTSLTLAGSLCALTGQIYAAESGIDFGSRGLLGTWLLELTVRDCQTGEPAGTTTNRALHSYLPGGSLVGSTNLTALRSPS